jgi:predicted metal-dependent hydrolase
MHKVDYDVLFLESKFCKPGREIYSKSGICSIVAEFDGRTLHIFYSNRTVWSNRLLQSWLRKLLKGKIIEVAEHVLPARLHYWEAQKNLKAKSVKVKKLRKTTLGCCSIDGCIELSPKILLMPESYMDSVILHEMAHLKYLHHRKSFWNFLTMLLGEDSNLLKVRMDIGMGIRYLYLD